MRHSKTLLVTLAFLFLVSLAIVAGSQSATVTVDQERYQLGEEVRFLLSGDLTFLNLRIVHDGSFYVYQGVLDEELAYTPDELGTYQVELLDKTMFPVAEVAFDVVPDEGFEEGSGSRDAGLTLKPAPGSIRPGTAITITPYGDLKDARLQLLTPEGKLRYNGLLEGDLGYVFSEPGTYTVELLSMSGVVLKQYVYVVAVPGGREEQVTPSSSSDGSQSSNAAGFPATLQTSVSVNVHPLAYASPFEDPAGRSLAATRGEKRGRPFYRLESGSVESIALLSPSRDGSIGVEELDPASYHAGKGFPMAAFAIDPRNATLNVSFIAKGTALHKCQDWNFTTSTCFGNWTKIMDLIPGERYTILVDAFDPGFLQTGLTTVNTRRPIYDAGDTAELLIVVLDPEGRVLSNASVSALVTDPNNVTRLFASPLDIVEQPDGTYALPYNWTSAQGRYDLVVFANDSVNDVNISSYFLVNDSMQYDIYRETPIVIDPFRETLNSTVRISPRQPGQYNVTETLPINFTNIIAPGASITADSSSWYLTWTNLSGNASITYWADAPLITPALELLGPLTIDHSFSQFIEGRSWYLALDPDVTDTGLTASTSSVEQGNTLTVTGNIFCTNKGGAAPDPVIWLEDDGVQVDTTSTSRDFYCPGTGSVNIDLCEAQSCTVQSDCSVAVKNCGKNDDVDITWTLTAVGDNEGLPSANTFLMDDDLGSTLDNSDSVTITADATAPSVTLNNPPVSYVNDSTPPVNITFNCSATDLVGLSEIELWYTDSDNTSFSQRDNCTASGTSDSCEWVKSLSYGNYTWNCRARDPTSNTAFAIANRTLKINGSGQADSVPTVTLVTPGPNSIDGDGNVYFECNASDNSDIVNITLFTNLSGSWAPNKTVSFPGAGNTSVTANFTIDGIANSTFFHWNCKAYDDNGGSAFASANRTLNVTYLPENPSVVLDSPGNATTENTEPVTFTCNATDNYDLASLNLYIDQGSGLQFEQTHQFTGQSDSDVSASFDVSGFTDGQVISWNCKAIDNNSNEVFAPADYDLTIDFLEPNVTLLTPGDYGYDLDGNLTVECNVQDNSDIVNVSLYHNLSGSWEHNQTITYGGSSDTNFNASFNIENVPSGSEFHWNCLAYDEDGFSAWGAENYTVTIPPVGTNYFAPDGDSGGTWSNPNRADEAADGQTANSDLDDQLNLYTFNYSGIPTAGTLLEAYLSLRWSVSTPPTNDYLGMQYSPDGAVNYYNLVGTLNGYTQPSSYPSSQANQSYLITGSLNLTELSSLYYRLTGFKVGPRDYSNAQIDALWLTARISPPPRYTGYGKNQSVVFPNDTITFWASWTDDISLDCDTFSIDQNGTWWNSSCQNLLGKTDNGTYSIQIDTAAGTTVYWRFYAQDNFGDMNVTPIQSFTVADANDSISPVITNLTATPSSAKALTQFNLSADITDNIGVLNATVEVTPPTGSAINYSMTQGGGNSWWALYDGLQGGTYTFRVFASDGNNNSNVSASSETFNVTPLVTTNKAYYDRSEKATISGYGFTALNNASFDVQNTTGDSQTGFPSLVLADATGNASKIWNIPVSLTYPLGNYTITGNDTATSLTDSTSVLIVAKPDSATKTDDVSSGDSVKALVNESDDSDATIVGNTVEAYSELRYQDLVQAGYTMDTLTLYVEHQDLDPESDTIDIQYYNGATWAAATCGSLTFRTTETIDACNLTADLVNIPDKNDIRLRLSDGNGGNDGVNFANIDFAYLLFDFSITNNLAVTIDEPTNLQSLYDYTDTASNSAYDGPVTAQPPAAQTTGTEANSSEYASLNTSDNDPWKSIVTLSGEYVSQSFYFSVSEAESDIVKLTITHEGYATQHTSLNADPYRIYLWNYDTNAYDVVSANPITATGSDQVTEIEITSGISGYINTNGEVNIFIQGDYVLAGCGNPANCRADMNTDYISLGVERINTIGGFQDINVTAIDGDGVQSCSYFFSQGVTSYTVYGLENVSSILWYNSSDTTAYADGVYNITANCTDGTEVNDTEYVTVRVLNVAPNVTLVAPLTNSNFTSSSVNFTWNASSDAGNPSCDLFIDGVEEIANVVSVSGQNTTEQVNNIPDGQHIWYVRCNIAGGAYNTTTTWNFTTDTTAPTVALNEPQNQTITNTTSVTFNYTPSDNNSLANCSLYIDGSWNQGNATISNGTPNYFTAAVSEGDHTWYVACQDEFDFVGTSGTYDITIDNTKPTITLSYPTPEQVFLGGVVQFNYTVTDNQDTSLVCNITIDGVVEDANIPSANATPIIRNLVVGDGFKEWNVTCVDNARNYNTSETRNFTVQGPPTVTLINPTPNEWLSYTGVDFIYYVEDGQGINNCSLYLDGAYNQTNSSVTNLSNNNFSVTMQQGHHNWTVECYDTTDKSTMPSWRNFTVDTTPPSILLYTPKNDTIQQDGNVTFSFNVTDNLDSSLICNITVNGVVGPTNKEFVATSGANTSRYTTGISNGDNYWNVTCVDEASLYNTSETWYFFMGSIPTVTLFSPGNNTQEQANVTFVYTPSDTYGLQNCSLYLNGAWNDTDYSVANGVQNEFNVTFSGEQHVSWYVNCTNDDGNPGVSGTYELDIDLTPPNITLNYPAGDTISTSNVTFNFTAYDNNASQLACDLYINGSLNVSGITADNGVPKTTLVTGFSSGFYTWNVTCADNASLSNWSATNNFTISFGPSVSLQYPSDGYTTNASNVSFNYTLSSGAPIANCSLLFNGTINQTKTGAQISHVGDGQQNNFTVTNIGESLYNWTVQCYDTNSVSSLVDEYRLLHVDRTAPNITLNYPAQNGNVSLSFVQFNFTAFDSVDDTLLCNLTVYNSGSLNKSLLNFNATEGIPSLKTLTGFSSGDYQWNVTCSDGLYKNTSETWNFTISNVPQVLLQSPYTGYSDPDGYVEFTYTPQTIAAGGWQYCQFIVDGVVNDTDVIIQNGVANTFNITYATSGTHTWQVNCTDQDNLNATGGPRNFSVDFVDPSVTANAPKGTIENSSVTFNFTATDNLDTNLTCDIYINGSVADTTWAQNGTPRIYTVNGLTDSFFTYYLNCSDESGRYNLSTTENFTVIEAPNVALGLPVNETRTTDTNWTLYYTPTDNSGFVDECRLYINGALNQTEPVPQNGVQNNFTLSNVKHGSYNWSINCTDGSGYEGASSQKVFSVDRLGPNISLSYPLEGKIFNQDDIFFNWTAIDFPGSTVTCDLWLDGSINVTGIQKTSPDVFNQTLYNLSDGPHNWTVNCSDDLGNQNSTGTRNFTINQPDLNITNDRVWVNNTNPNLLENITIYANVSNDGGRDAANVLVEFWDGPVGVGTLIGNDTANVNVNQTVTFSTTWNITAGYHTITVVVDPNNVVGELNETNNNATYNISPLWINVSDPASNTYTNNENTTFTFTPHDHTGSPIDYLFYINGAPSTSGTTTDNVVTLDNVTLTEGNRSIVIQITDALGRKRNSTIIYRIYDATPPTTNYETINGTFFNDTTPEISFNFSDALSTLINYTVYVDGAPETANSSLIDTSISINLSALGEGWHIITVEATDQANNTRNTSINISVDLTDPQVNLTSPADGQNFTTTAVQLNFTVTDTVDPLLQCNLTLDGTVIRSNFSVINGSTSETNLTGLSEATHYWNVTCWDGNNVVNQVVNKNTSETRSFNVFVPPVIHLIDPLNNEVTNQENITFLFNVSDETGLANCSLYFNGAWNQTKTAAQLTNNATNNFTVNNLYGIYDWNITCWDNASFSSQNWSETWTITVDTIAPYPTFETVNESWFNTTTPTVDFNITDDFDSLIFYTIYADGVQNTNGSVAEGISSSTALSALGEGTHQLILEGTDDAGNKRNSTPLTIFIDLTAPNITLTNPPDGNITNSSTVNFNFTAYDNMDGILNCTLTVSGEATVNLPATNGSPTNYTLTNLATGVHYWNVTCVDEAGNSNHSVTWNFTVPSPDLTITAGNITLSNSSPIEDQNITVNATIFNIGVSKATGITVQFWLGDPALGGSTQIGTNQTIASLLPGANATVSVNHTAVIGSNAIYVVVDPPIATNGSIEEENETNNKAFTSFLVGFYNYFGGNTSNVLRVTDSALVPLWTWNISNATGSNILIADGDSSIGFTSLQALGRNTTNQSRGEDFSELDQQLNAENLSDNVNFTWTAGGVPKETREYLLFSRTIANVPVVNSTNTSAFKTGILWDTGDGGNDYNGTQDVVFITKINESQLGSRGIYDYEARVPAPLRDYTGGTSIVTFYVELR